MGFFDEWDQGKRINPDKLEKETVLDIDRFDREDIERIAEELTAFAAARESLCEVAPTGNHLWTDAFSAFVKFRPEVRSEGQINPRFLINRAVVEQMMALPEYERDHEWTAGDLMTSAMALEGMEEELEGLYDRHKTFEKEAENLERMLEELIAAEEGQALLEEIIEDAFGDLDPDDVDGQAQLQAVQSMLQAAKDAIEEMRQAAAAAGADLEAHAKLAAASAIPGMKAAMKKSADDAESDAASARAWGMQPGQLQRLDPNARIKLAERMHNPKFDYFADMVGRMLNIAFAEQTHKVYDLPEEVYDVGLGADLSRLLPSELLALADPVTEIIFYQKYLERDLLEYEMRGEDKVGKGGIHLLMDNSYSMVGVREMWAKAVGLCMLQIARMQDREFYGIHFSTRGQIEEFDFRDIQHVTVEQVLEYGEHFLAGGTWFETPLDRSLELFEEEFAKTRSVKGDIVFVTDDLCDVSDEWLAKFLAAKERLGFKVWGIAIGASTKTLEKFCDNTRLITDLQSGEQVRDIFRDV